MSLEASWFALLCRSRARQGIEMPPFYWGALKHWWGWRHYVLRPLTKPFRSRKSYVVIYPTGNDDTP